MTDEAPKRRAKLELLILLALSNKARNVYEGFDSWEEKQAYREDRKRRNRQARQGRQANRRKK